MFRRWGRYYVLGLLSLGLFLYIPPLVAPPVATSALGVVVSHSLGMLSTQTNQSWDPLISFTSFPNENALAGSIGGKFRAFSEPGRTFVYKGYQDGFFLVGPGIGLAWEERGPKYAAHFWLGVGAENIEVKAQFKEPLRENEKLPVVRHCQARNTWLRQPVSLRKWGGASSSMVGDFGGEVRGIVVKVIRSVLPL